MVITLKKALKSAPIVYVARDIERALGLIGTEGYYIITNKSPLSTVFAKKNKNCIVVSGEKTLDTYELLQHPDTKKFLQTLRSPRLLVFKNTQPIEEWCKQNSYTLLNPPAALSKEVEEKISQVAWLAELQKYLPPHRITLGKELVWEGHEFIVQFNRAHTGTGTLLMQSENDVRALAEKFPNRELRVSDYITGPAFTNNNIVTKSTVIVGPINYQITGLKPFTDNQFATIGNDWSLPKKLLTKKMQTAYKEMAVAIGEKLGKSGWRGLFGIDVILDSTANKLYLIEINARQPASTTFESELQTDTTGSTTFAAHCAALTESAVTKTATVKSGAQIIVRVPETGNVTSLETKIKALQKLGLNVIVYNNTEPGSDLLRIQSKKGLMKAHNEFNELGEKIKTIIQ